MNQSLAEDRRVLADRRTPGQRRTGFDRRVVADRRRATGSIDPDRRGSDRRGGGDRRVGPPRRSGVPRRTATRDPFPDLVRVLVVDTDEGVRRGLRRIIETRGHHVVEAKDAQAALSWTAETPAPVVIANLRLPDMDGVEFVRRIRDLVPGGRVIALSVRPPYGTPDPLAAAVQVARVQGLRMPVTPDAILAAVDRATRPAPPR